MFRGQSHISKFLVAVAEGDPWTRTRIGVAALPILVIEARPKVAKDIGLALLVVAIFFGLSVGVALIFHYI